MLVLTRRVGEQLVIGEGPNRIVVTVCEIRDGKVRIGTEAPDGTPVDRLEVWEAKERERKREQI